METTLFLSQVLGLFLIIAGAAVLYRKQYFVPVIGQFVEERLTRMLMGMLELLAGLFLVVAHTDWSSLAAGIITAIGYALVIEGAAYLLMPDRIMRSLIKSFNVRLWYHVGGTLAIFMGVYLCFVGFSLI